MQCLLIHSEELSEVSVWVFVGVSFSSFSGLLVYL